MPKEKKVFNPPAAVARNCFIVAAAGILAFIYPIVFAIKTDGLSFALVFIGSIIFLAGLISGFIFRKMAGNLDKLVSGEGLLAQWTYSQDEWSRLAEAEHIRDKHDKWMLFRMIAIAAVVIGGILVIYKNNAWLIALISIAVLIPVIAVVTRFSVASGYRRNRAHPGEIYIGKSGVLVGHSFHYWKMASAYLHSAVIEAGNPPFVKFVYAAPSGQAKTEYTARFPVPQGHGQEAKQVITELAAEIYKE